MKTAAFLLAGAVVLAGGHALGEKNWSTRTYRGTTTAAKDDYCVSYSPLGCKPKNFEYWRYSKGPSYGTFTPGSVSTHRTRGSTSVSKDDYCIANGPVTCTPKSYEQYYYHGNVPK